MDYPQDIIARAGEVCDVLSIPSTPLNCIPIMDAILAERERCAQVAETVSFKDHWVVTTPEHLADITDDDGEIIGQYKVGARRSLDSRSVIAAAIRAAALSTVPPGE